MRWEDMSLSAVVFDNGFCGPVTCDTVLTATSHVTAIQVGIWAD